MASGVTNRESMSWISAVLHKKSMKDKNTTWGKVPFFTDSAPDSSAGQREPFNPPLVHPHNSAELFLQTHGPHRVSNCTKCG